MYGAVFSREYYLSKFVESITVSRPMTGEILYYSNKLSEANLSTSVTLGEIRAGVGNPIIGIIPSDSNLTVEITDQNLDIAIRAYQTGGLHGFGAPTRVCQDVEAKGTPLAIDPSVYGAPVAGQGMTEALCYVQTVGAESTIVSDGMPYQIAADGTISGFDAVLNTTYKVWYWANLPTTEYTTILADMDPSVVTVRFVYPVYSNLKEDGTGTRIGSLEVVVPFMKFGGNAGINGNGSSNVNTTISGQAIAYQNPIVQAGCGSCTDASAALAHYLYIPCNSGADSIQGLFYVGGAVEIATNSSKQLEFLLMVNGNPVRPDPALMRYQALSAPTGTSVSASGVVTTGATAGSFEVNGTYQIGENSWSCPVNVEVADVSD